MDEILSMLSLTFLKSLLHILPFTFVLRVTHDLKGACTLTQNICMYIRRIQPSCLHQLFCCLFLSLLTVGSSPGLITSVQSVWKQQLLDCRKQTFVFLFCFFTVKYLSSPLNVLCVGFSFLQITRRSLARIMARVKRVFPTSWRRSVEQTCFSQQ